MSRYKPKAFTLVEVLIGVAILAYAVTGVVAGIVFAMRMTRLNTNAVIAKNITQSFFERMHSDIFANVNSTTYPNIDYTSVPPVWLDQALNIRCKVEFRFRGFGRAEGGSSLTVRDNGAGWVPNEWAGSRVYLVAGTGVGQYRTIVSNTADTLTISGTPLLPAPANGTAFMINNGKTVEIKTTWKYTGKEYSQTIRSLVVNYRNDANLGF